VSQGEFLNLPIPPSPWASEEASVFGDGPLVAGEAADPPAAELGNAVVVGLDAAGALPPPSEAFDILLTTAPSPPRPWVQVQSIDQALAMLGAAVTANPQAATILAQVLRAQRGVGYEAALHIESFAYSTLLGGEEFRRWRAATRHAPPPVPADHGPAVLAAREGSTLRLSLARPWNENAMTAEMRDALVEALRAARADPGLAVVEVRGEGRLYCTGGALHEFGTATDLTLAHHIRTVRSVALAIHRLEARSRFVIHGAAVGSGLEIAAAADEVEAHPATFFSLPEVSMGLIPGAGGTVSVARRIGRRRACYLALSGLRLRARTALAWGLVDRLGEA
jgi:hypothetical protein